MYRALIEATAYGKNMIIETFEESVGPIDNCMPAEGFKKLYNEFKLLHNYFGQGGNDVMKRLKKIRAEALE